MKSQRTACNLVLVMSASLVISLFSGCVEMQNKVSRSVQNVTGVSGVLDILSGGKVVHRFLKVEKMTTATATSGSETRPYRFGWGYLDENQNYRIDSQEKKVYFEVSEFSSNYVFYENPKE